MANMHSFSVFESRWRPAAIGCALIAIAGCGPRVTSEQMQTLDEARAAYKQKQFDYAVRLTSRLIEEAPESDTRWDARMTRGLAYAQLNRPDAARQDLTICAEASSGPANRWRAHAALGTLAFESRDWAGAERYYSTALAEMPGGPARKREPTKLETLWEPLEEAMTPTPPPIEAVLFRIGCAKERQGKWDAAREEFGRIASEYPTSAFAEAAQRRLDARADHFAILCGEYNEPSVAERHAGRMRHLGFEVYVRPEERAFKTVYVVLVGRYERFEDAEAALPDVRWQSGNAQVWP